MDELREAVARLNGSMVEKVQVPPDRKGWFGLRLALTCVRADGTTQRRLRWLTVLSVAWRLDGPDAVLAASGDDQKRLAGDLAVLLGRKITAVDVQLPGWDTRIRFGDHVLTIFPVHHGEPSAVPDWTFRTPSGQLLVVGSGPRWTVIA